MVLAFDGVVEDCLCCNKCPTEGDVEVIISGFTLCDCLVVPPGIFAKAVSSTGITGGYTVPFDATNPGGTTWQLDNIGTISIQFYSDMCVTPDGEPTVSSVSIRVQCSNGGEDNNINVQIFTPGALIFFNVSGQFSTAINNPVACSDFTNFALVSTVTVDPPP